MGQKICPKIFSENVNKQDETINKFEQRISQKLYSRFEALKKKIKNIKNKMEDGFKELENRYVVEAPSAKLKSSKHPQLSLTRSSSSRKP